MQFFKRTALLGAPIRLTQIKFALLTVCASLVSILLPVTAQTVEPPSLTVRKYFRLAPFYRQWVDVEGLPVVASEKVNPYALEEAAWLIRHMIGHRPEVLRAMARNRVRFSVMAYNEMTTQIPEHSDLRPGFYWDLRARGFGSNNCKTSGELWRGKPAQLSGRSLCDGKHSYSRVQPCLARNGIEYGLPGV